MLPPAAAGELIDAREKAFWMAKANGADDIIDIVVPRASIPVFMDKVSALATEYEAWIAGCGHAGDGNVHLGVFCADDPKRSRLLTALFAAGMALGGAISGEHGIGEAKKPYFLDLEDPTKIALMRRIKAAFDPHRHPQPRHRLRLTPSLVRTHPPPSPPPTVTYTKGSHERRTGPDPHARRLPASTSAS